MLPGRLPVLRIVSESLAGPWRHRRELLPVLAAPAILALVVAVATALAPDSLWTIAGQLAVWLAFVPVETAWHRFLIDGEKPSYRWRRAESRYFGYTLALMFFMVVPFLLAYGLALPLLASAEPWVQGLGAGAATIVVLLLTAALWLRLPALATGRHLSFAEAFALARGEQLRLAATAVLVLALFRPLDWLSDFGVWAAAAANAFGWLMILIVAGALSLCFLNLGGGRAVDQAPGA